MGSAHLLFGQEEPQAKVTRVPQGDRPGDGCRESEPEEPARAILAVVAGLATAQVQTPPTVGGRGLPRLQLSRFPRRPHPGRAAQLLAEHVFDETAPARGRLEKLAWVALLAAAFDVPRDDERRCRDPGAGDREQRGMAELVWLAQADEEQ